MTTSNIYLAFGEVDSVMVMKVGMTDSITKRQASLKIKISKWVKVRNRKIALSCEERFRMFASILEAVHYSGVDWFVYDEIIYAQLENFLFELSLAEKPNEKAYSLVGLANINRIKREIEATRLEGETVSECESRYYREKWKREEPEREAKKFAEANSRKRLDDLEREMRPFLEQLRKM